MKLVAPSILSADFGRINEEVTAVDHAGADWIHIDVMDGHFVPNLTMGPDMVKAIRRQTRLPIDVHLMVENPEQCIGAFADAGATHISYHVEVSCHAQKIARDISNAGCKVGIALCPSTPLSQIEHLWPDIDYILLMTVNPGFSGQSFIPQSFDKIKEAHRLRQQYRPDVLLEVDGGVSDQNAAALKACGIDVFVSGSYVFKHASYETAIAALK